MISGKLVDETKNFIKKLVHKGLLLL
jgi:hypothetical protein